MTNQNRRPPFLAIFFLVSMLSFDARALGQSVSMSLRRYVINYEHNRTLLYFNPSTYKVVSTASFLMSRIMKRDVNVIWPLKKNSHLPQEVLFSDDFSNLVVFSEYIGAEDSHRVLLYRNGVEVGNIAPRDFLYSDCYDRIVQEGWTIPTTSPPWIHRVELNGDVLKVTTLEGYTHRFSMETGDLLKRTFNRKDLNSYSSVQNLDPVITQVFTLKPRNCEKYYKGPKEEK